MSAHGLVPFLRRVLRRESTAHFSLVAPPPALPEAPFGFVAGLVSRTERVHPDDLRRLGGHIERQRRLLAAESYVASELAGGLDGWCWHIERHVFVGQGFRLPLLVCGPTGVFAVVVTDGGWERRDLEMVAAAAVAVGGELPRYPDPVRALIVLCGEQASGVQWTFAGGHTGYTVGSERLSDLLLSFSDQGFGPGDIAVLRQHAQVDWGRRVQMVPMSCYVRGVG